MTVVKDDEVPNAEEGTGANEVAGAGDNIDLELMTDSKLADDWSIIGSKGLDNEGSDGESVEVIPCEEEKSEADSCSADGTSPNKLAVETQEKIMQTEESVFFQNFTIWHPACIALSVICPILIYLLYYSGEPSNLENESLPVNWRPAAVDVMKDWDLMSTRSSQEKSQIKHFLKLFFPLEEYDEEVAALLEKDMVQYSSIPTFHKNRPYTPNPPPSFHKRERKFLERRFSRQLNENTEERRSNENTEERKSNENTEERKSNENGEDKRYDCSICKSYCSECRKFCKRHSRAFSMYDKYINPFVEMVYDAVYDCMPVKSQKTAGFGGPNGNARIASKNDQVEDFNCHYCKDYCSECKKFCRKRFSRNFDKYDKYIAPLVEIVKDAYYSAPSTPDQ